MSGARGSILILVLWSLSLFTVFSISLGVAARQRATLLSRLETHENLYAIASSGIERGKIEIAEDLDEDLDTFLDLWTENPGAFREIAVGNGLFNVGYEYITPDGKQGFRYGIEDAERKINLNKADSATLSRLFQIVVELGVDEAGDLAESIIDWRDKDSGLQHPDRGAEDDTYEDLSLPYEAKDSLLESPDELLLIKGMKRDIFDKIKAYTTLYGSGSVNINTTSKVTLLALGLDEKTVDKIVMFRSGADEIEGTSDDNIFPQAGAIVTILDRVIPPLTVPQSAAVQALVDADKLGAFSTCFMIKSRATAAGAAYLDIETVVDRQGKVYYSKSSGVRR